MGALPDKRQRLIAAAFEVFYRQGFGASSLAQIAQQAEVPLGNVYYYFKTKDSLLQAVVDCHLQEVQQALKTAEQEPTAEDRLVALFRLFSEGAEQMAQYGCPVGSLVQELEKLGGPLGQVAARPLDLQRQWLQRQFVELGQGEQAESLALAFLCNGQGAVLIAHALRDPEVLRRRCAEMIDDIRRLAPANPSLH